MGDDERYFNTTHVAGQTLSEFRRKAGKQNKRVLDHFMRNPLRLCSPSQVQREVLPEAPLTSVRRAMTTLADAGFLEKTTFQIEGVYGRPEHCWRLAPKFQGDEQQSLF